MSRHTARTNPATAGDSVPGAVREASERAVLIPAAREATTASIDPDAGLTACCLINHFQYGPFVEEAVASAARQTRPLDEIVVVDDGSKDGSLEILRAVCEEQPGVRLIAKENGGQLSCFEAGIAATVSDVVFFLDADDAWDPAYVETVLRVFEERPDVDFVACNERRVFPDGRSEVTELSSRDLGYSMARSLAQGGAFMGKPTSCLAIRRRILDAIFPLDLVQGWRTCADEALVFGSSLVGAHKYFLGEPLVRYRIHGNNHHYGREYNAKERMMRTLEVLRLVETLRKRQGLPRSLAHLAHHEFRTIENPTRRDYRDYRRMVATSDLDRRRKRRLAWVIWVWYWFRRRG